MSTPAEFTASESAPLSILQKLRRVFTSPEAALYAAALLICAIVTVWALNLHHGHIRYPYLYQGDTMFYHLIVKSLFDQSWFLTNPMLGAPFFLDLRDVPTSDNNLYLVLLKLTTLVTGRYGRSLNLFFLASFPLVICTSVWVSRKLGLSRWAALLVSVLYTFLPFHFSRGEHHLFLSQYFTVPLIVLVTLWLSRGELHLYENASWRSPARLVTVGICLLVASTGYYYAFFACFLFLLGGVLCGLQERKWRGFWLAGGLVALITGVLVLHLWPSIAHQVAAGSANVINRTPAEADVYSLRIAQLLMPVRNHRLKALEDFKIEYNKRLLINENDDASLGLLGSLGFLALLLWLFIRKPALTDALALQDVRLGWLHQLSVLNLATLLLATMGGFGTLMAYLVPQVRAYTRLSIFIAFFAFLTIGFGLDYWYERRLAKSKGIRWFYGVTALLCVIGLLDQISPVFRPDYAKANLEFEQDAEFVRQIEAKVPVNAMIFQLPMMSFPENPKVNRMNDYDHLRGYLHSRQLRWSYGTVKGREQDVWMRSIAAKPLPEMLEALSWAGFQGLWVDRFGYNDGGTLIEKELRALLGPPQVGNANNRTVFFNLAGLRQKLVAQTPPAEQVAKQTAILRPLLSVWQGSCSDLEGTPADNWRWCGRRTGYLRLVNRTGQAKRVQLQMNLQSEFPGTLRIRGPFFNETLRLDKPGLPFDRSFVLPPGEHVVSFDCDARRVLPLNDFRDLVFRVRNYKLIEIP